MREFLKISVLQLLILLARIRLRRLRPFIIGVTGSIGKTSTTAAIYTILSSRYRVFKSAKSYNTEFGLPLAILQQESGFSSPLKWLKTIFGAMWKAFFGGKNIQMIVLEMGVDKPGDMERLLKLVRPQVGVMSNIRPVHLAEGQFKDLEDIFREKSKLIFTLPQKGVAVLNADDPYVLGLKDKLGCKTIFYGMAETADVRVAQVESSLEGLTFTIVSGDEVVNGCLPLLGGFQIYMVLAAVSVALTQGFTLGEAVKALENYRLPPGRMNPISGLEDSVIIDSSYNASPAAMQEALDILKTFRGRRIAVLGSMNELGEYEEAQHREIGAYSIGRTDMLLTLGKAAKWIHDEAKKKGFDDDLLQHFEDVMAAAKYLKKIIQKGDTILVKGSQNNVRLEKLVKLIMKEPERANELLVRQEGPWRRV